MAAARQLKTDPSRGWPPHSAAIATRSASRMKMTPGLRAGPPIDVR